MPTKEYFDLWGNRKLEVVVERAKRKHTANGYPSPPGSGPEGETCKTCEFKTKIGGKYWKCLKFKSPRAYESAEGNWQWSASVSSDIRLKSPACGFWEPALSKTPQQRQNNRIAFKIKPAS